MRVQPDNIMCTVDFSQFTSESLGYSVALCKKFNAKLLLVHIVSDVNTSVGHAGMAFHSVQLQEKNIQNSKEDLEDMVKDLAIDYEIVVTTGNPADEICQLAREHGIDLVIAATHGNSGFKRLLLGSVTEKLLKTLECPLLALHAKEHEFATLTEHDMKLEKILVGCDFSPDSKLAFDYSLSLAQEYQAEIYLTHIIKETEHIELTASEYMNVVPDNYVHWRNADYLEIQQKVTSENRENVKELREKLKGQLFNMLPAECKNWCTPHITLLSGEPFKELIKCAKEQKVDLIVLGIRGHTLWENLMVGSTTDRVIRHAPCPVLAVRQMEW